MNKKRLVRNILIPLAVFVLIVGSVSGLVYFVQGKNKLDWAAGAIAKDYGMVYFNEGYYSYLIDPDFVDLPDGDFAVLKELTISEEDSIKKAEAFIEKYNLNDGYEYKIYALKQENHNNVKGEYYYVSVQIERKYPPLILNNKARRKNWITMSISDDGIFCIEYL